MALAVLTVVISVPFAWHKVIGASELVRDWRMDWSFLFGKSDFGLLRYVHFLALAYLAWVAAGEGGARLRRGGLPGAAIAIVSQVGQQSLAVFAASMVLARVLGAFLNLAGGGVRRRSSSTLRASPRSSPWRGWRRSSGPRRGNRPPHPDRDRRRPPALPTRSADGPDNVSRVFALTGGLAALGCYSPRRGIPEGCGSARPRPSTPGRWPHARAFFAARPHVLPPGIGHERQDWSYDAFRGVPGGSALETDGGF